MVLVQSSWLKSVIFPDSSLPQNSWLLPALNLRLTSLVNLLQPIVKMVKRGSPYLRWALLEAARLISVKDPRFRAYYLKKKAEGKHHFVATSHVAKKLVRVLHHLLIHQLSFTPQS